MNTNTDTQTYITALWDALPEPVQAALSGLDVPSQLSSICSEHTLTDADTESIAREVWFVLLGAEQREELQQHLASALSEPNEETVTKLLATLDTKIFHPLGELLQQNQDEQASGYGTKQSTQSPLEQFVKKDADVQARFEKLPEGVRNEIFSPEVTASFSTLVREHALEQEAFMTFGAHVVRVLTGLENVNDLRTALRDKKIVAHEEVEPFAQQVEAGMVKPVRDAIVKEVGKRKAAK